VQHIQYTNYSTNTHIDTDSMYVFDTYLRRTISIYAKNPNSCPFFLANFTNADLSVFGAAAHHSS